MNTSKMRLFSAASSSLFFTAILISNAILSGAIRALLSVTIGIAFIAGLIPVLLAGYWLRRRVRNFTTAEPSSVVLLYSLVFGGGACFLLYHGPFQGLVSVGGGDAGNHVYSFNEFLLSNPLQNSGFVTFFSLSYWFGRLFNLDIFSSFRLTYFLEILFVAFAQIIFFLWMTDTSKRSSKRLLFSSAVLALVSFFPAERILLPLLHYLQGAGFFPQLFGLVPMLLCFLCLPIMPTIHHAAFCLAVFLGLQRFSYGLNLGDSAAAAAIFLSAVPYPSASRAWRFAYAGFFSVVAYFVYSRLAPIMPLTGEITRVNFALQLAACFTGSVALYVVYRFFGREAGAPNASENAIFRARLLLYPAALNAVSVLAAALFSIFVGDSSSYYIQKYLLLSTASIALLLTGATTALLLRIWEHQKGIFDLRVVCVALSLFSLYLLNKTYHPYWASFFARIRQSTDTVLLSPFRDIEAETIIRQVLTEGENNFGGFLVPDWPQSNFMNASLGAYGELPLYRHGRFPKRSNACVFWRNDPEALESFRKQNLFRVIKKIEALKERPHVRLFRYRSRELGAPRELGAVCPSAASID